MQINEPYACPKCGKKTTIHPDESYHGEMHECIPCSFMAYFDEWDEGGLKYQPSSFPF